MKKPVIGITGNEKAHPDDDIMMSYAAKGFVEGVKDAGGIPIILPIGDQEMAAYYISIIDKLILTGGQNVPLVLTKYGIRKLLPKECFLFQGYPEDFILPEEIAQSHLYKQAGNSVVVPVINRLAKNIMEALKKTDNGIHGGENEKNYKLFTI